MNSTSSIITIGREYGSGGRQIGQEVAKYFGIKCYDKELLEHAANESGICKELFENHDERPTNSFLYSLVMDTYSFGYSSSGFTDMPMNHKIFLAQFDAIKKLASEGPCVMVGKPARLSKYSAAVPDVSCTAELVALRLFDFHTSNIQRAQKAICTAYRALGKPDSTAARRAF